MKRKPKFPVIVAGGGPVGLALALGLSEQGVESIVLESKPTPDPHSRAPALHARTLEILQGWGVLDEFLAEGKFLSRADFWKVEENAPVMTVDFSPLAALTAWPGVLVLPQPRTEAILLEAVRKQNLAEVRFGHRVSGITQKDGEGRARVQPDGGAGYEVRGEFLVGCDGAHSLVREQLGMTLEGKTYPTGALLADVRFADGRADLPWPRVASRSRGALFALKIDREVWRVISVGKPGEATSPAPESVRPKVEALFGAGPFETIWVSDFRLHCRTSRRFVVGRVALAGDAGHLNSPAGGQGMNSGIQDAHNLAWKLARAVRGAEWRSLLESYETERYRAITMNVDRFTDLLTRFVQLRLPFLRAGILSMLKQLLRRRAFLDLILPQVAMLNTRYDESPLFGAVRGQVGRRAPDGWVTMAGGARVRLQELAHPHGMLIYFGVGAPPPIYSDTLWQLKREWDLPFYSLLRSKGGPLEDGAILSDRSGAIWKQWDPDEGRFALLRPDGYVGWEATFPSITEIAPAIARALGGPSSVRQPQHHRRAS